MKGRTQIMGMTNTEIRMPNKSRNQKQQYTTEEPRFSLTGLVSDFWSESSWCRFWGSRRLDSIKYISSMPRTLTGFLLFKTMTSNIRISFKQKTSPLVAIFVTPGSCTERSRRINLGMSFRTLKGAVTSILVT